MSLLDCRTRIEVLDNALVPNEPSDEEEDSPIGKGT